MTKKVLVAYSTNAGSTTEVAKTIGEMLDKSGAQTDVRLIKNVTDLSSYDAVVVGAPMALGWHKEAVKFLKKHEQELSQKPVAYFITALNLTKSTKTSLGKLTIFQDPILVKEPKDKNKLSFKEKHSTAASYLSPVLKKTPHIKPVSAGFFAGKVDYDKLGFFQRFFLKVFIKPEIGDFRNWEAIRIWAAGLPNTLLKKE